MPKLRKHRQATLVLLPALGLFLLLAFGADPGETQEGSALGHLTQAVRNILAEAAGAIEPPPQESPGGEDAAIPDPYARPPVGAAHNGPGREAQAVSSPVRRLRDEAKAVPEEGGGYLSNSAPATEAPGAWRQLGFESGSFQPEPGVDAALAQAASSLKAKGRRHVYGFLITKEYLTDANRSPLEALGVKLLGPHGSAYKARFPADVSVLDRVGALGYVEWLGFSRREQKMSGELQAALAADAGAPDELPVVINLFENDRGFADQLSSAGAVLGKYDPELVAYRAVVGRGTLDVVLGLDFVLFVELARPTFAGHDQSAASIGVDYIRPGAPGTAFDGSTIPIGIMDTGFMLGGAAAVPHVDLNAWGCGINYTSDAAGVWNDENSHGTHVLGTILGRGVGDSRYRGVGIGIGGAQAQSVRAAKVWGASGSGDLAWMESAMDFLDDATACGGDRPLVVNISGGGTGTNLLGTDSLSRKLDGKVYDFNQMYVSCGGNTGPGAGTIWTPGVAKNALAVGNALDNGYLTVGDISNTSSRGPAGDGRRKPNVVGPGTVVTSARAGTTNLYSDKTGCSMATPHVTGLAATLMQHYTSFQSRPAVLRSFLMATAIHHDDVLAPDNTYGFGRVSAYASHWAWPGANGWGTNWFWGNSSGTGNWVYGDITVPAGTDRLVVVLTWDEPAASAGAPRAVQNDVDLWVDQNNDCGGGNCGEYASASVADNVEYVVVSNPPSGLYRLKAYNYNVSQTVHLGFSAFILEGDPTPDSTLAATPSTSTPVIGTDFTITTTVSNPAYIASGVHLENTALPAGVVRVGVQTTREDAIGMSFGTATNLTLGNIHAGDARSAVWTFRLTTPGTKVFTFRSWSENAGTDTVNVTVVDAKPDLQVTALGAPASAEPGQGISVSNTVRNLGQTTAPGSILRLYHSTDSVCTTSDTYLPPERTVPSLAVSGTSTASTTVTIPGGTALGDSYICAIADPGNAIAESDEGNNTRSTPISIVRPDLQVTALTGPASAPAGSAITVNDTVRNLGTGPAAGSVLRLYSSPDSVCTTGDTYLAPQRAVPALAVNGTSSGTTSVTIPLTTPPGARYICAIADYNNAVTESNEGNNTRSYPITVTAPPAPTVDLEINGMDAAYPLFVTTPGRIKLTIDMTAGTAPLAHYYAIIFGGTVYWVDPMGNLVLTPTPIATFTPVNLNDYVLLDADFSAYPGFWGFAWIMLDGATAVGSDVILANVAP